MTDAAIALGDVLSVLKRMPDCSADAVFCDPPYGIGTKQPTGDDLVAYLSGAELDTGGDFMGKSWSVPSVAVWREAFRVLKPGAPLLAFAGSRTCDLVTLGVRAAGFEIRDTLMYMYGSGFPKGQNISKAIDKTHGHWRGRAGAASSENVALGGTNYERTPLGEPVTPLAKLWDGYDVALKPAFEPIILARKPLEGTMAQNVTKWGVGGLAIDACRIDAKGRPHIVQEPKLTANNALGQGIHGSRAAGTTDEGRWPANVLLDETAAAHLDEVVGDRKSGIAVQRNGGGGKIFGSENRRAPTADAGYSDSGGPSRFFFTAKVSTKERNAGCEPGTSTHPTLKPLALTRYLATLIKPPQGGRLVIPFAGAGSEVIGAIHAGWTEVIGIEREPEYAEIARARIAHWVDKAPARRAA